jgi:hypothetical protein
MTQLADFAAALAAIKKGLYVARLGWARGLVVAERAFPHAPDTRALALLHPGVDGVVTPFSAESEDFLAGDWYSMTPEDHARLVARINENQ